MSGTAGLPISAQAKRLHNRGSIAMGIAVICGLFLIETVVAHQTTPNPLSPLVWTVLGGVGAVSVVLAAVWRAQARRLTQARA